jgi:hypothetical protein
MNDDLQGLLNAAESDLERRHGQIDRLKRQQLALLIALFVLLTLVAYWRIS